MPRGIPKSSASPVQEELFPSLTPHLALSELILQIEELERVIVRMKEAVNHLGSLPGESPFNVTFCDSVSFYQGVLLTLKL